MDYLRLLLYNIRVNGLKSLIYPFGLSEARYIEYTTALKFLQGERGRILDLGCGHSLLPSLLATEGADIIAMDVNRDSMTWQKEKAGRNSLESIQANGLYLPFQDGAFSAVVSISVLEHIRNDSQVIRELARVIKNEGVLILSIPISQQRGFTEDVFFGIPTWQRRILSGNVTRYIMKKLNVDRGGSYFERFYSREELLKRIIKPSFCTLEGYRMYWDWIGMKLIDRFIPKGFFAPLQFIFAEISSHSSRKPTHLGGIVLKLRKGHASNYLGEAMRKLEPF